MKEKNDDDDEIFNENIISTSSKKEDNKGFIEEYTNNNEIIKSTSSKKEIDNEFLEQTKNYYKNIKFINKSNISTFYEAENIKEDKKVFLKAIGLKNLELNYEYFIRQIKREEEILKLCESNNIIKLYKEFKTKNYIILELEYCGIDFFNIYQK